MACRALCTESCLPHATPSCHSHCPKVTQLRKHVQTLEESLHNQTALLEASETDYQELSKEMAKLSESPSNAHGVVT